mmetsp:Transcript_43388/g.112872  ORF Transcript_43388/g.112872 Transcript_43388/m.112872 type:complete len:220 (+) Transcript_43388:1027-1686(+)
MSSRRTTTRSLVSATGGGAFASGGDGYFSGSYQFGGSVRANGFYCTCSRLKKEKIQRDVLNKEALESSLGLTIYSYRYLDPPYSAHIGPMAEELRNASELFVTHVVRESEDGHLQVSPDELNYVRTEALKARTDDLMERMHKWMEKEEKLFTTLSAGLEKVKTASSTNTTYIDQLNARLHKAENRVKELEDGIDELRDDLRRRTTSFFAKWFCRREKAD